MDPTTALAEALRALGELQVRPDDDEARGRATARLLNIVNWLWHKQGFPPHVAQAIRRAFPALDN